VDAARGDFIAWLDDDVTVSREWLTRYAEAFTTHPRALVFGGPIIPDFGGAAPAWLIRVLPRVGGAFAARDLGPTPAPLSVDGNRIPYGANYAVSATAQRRHRYDPALGRRPDAPSMIGEEVAVIEALLAEGEGWWVPGASVTHRIAAARQSIRHLRGFFAAYGRTLERTAALRDSAARLAWRAAVADTRYRLRRPFVPPEVWIEDLALAGEAWGRLTARRRGEAGPRSRGPGARP
jgi:hypothetical protein